MNLNNNLLQLFMLLNSQSNTNFLVGGCVRDSLLGIEPKDFDIVSNVSMDTIETLFSQNGWKVESTGKTFLVMNVSKNGDRYEIANFRKDGVYTDGRRPESVEIGNIEQDAKRRDFTVNALYLDPIKHRILDPLDNCSSQSGKRDIEDRILRFIGKPKDRIEEDYLRVFRFYRFLTKGFEPDKKSLKACRELFNKAYKETTPERARVEIERMVKI